MTLHEARRAAIALVSLVILTGCSDRRESSQSATDATRQADGETAQASEATNISIDDRVREDVESLFVRDSELRKREIAIRVEDAVVELSGNVASVSEKYLANELALSVPGVRGVTDLLKITRMTPPARTSRPTRR